MKGAVSSTQQSAFSTRETNTICCHSEDLKIRGIWFCVMNNRFLIAEAVRTGTNYFG